MCWLNSEAQTIKEKLPKARSVYFAWGYNTEWYTKSDVHVKQKDLGNDYRLTNVRGHDHRGWDDNFFRKELSIPQYSWRIGYYFNDRQDMAIELNFDHTKYIITDSQTVGISGKLDGAAVDRSMLYSRSSGFFYFLNNGANFLLLNFVKRFGVYHTPNNDLGIDLFGKAGLGITTPHVENMFFGKLNDPHFQFGGWNAGIETAVRVTIMKYAFLEFSQKVDYARYSNLKIYKGIVNHSFGTYELILTAGCALPTTKNNPMFKKKNAVPKLADDANN
jgi:hypothetical protein